MREPHKRQDIKQAISHLAALGLDNSKIEFRYINKKNHTSKALYGTIYECGDELLELNRQGYNIYFVVNGCNGEELGIRYKENLRIRQQIKMDNACKPVSERLSDDEIDDKCDEYPLMCANKDITSITSLYIDCDEKADSLETHLAKVNAYNIKPSFYIESSKGKAHFYWIVKDFPVDMFTRSQKDLISIFGSDKKIHNLARIMALAGFWKHATEKSEASMCTFYPYTGEIHTTSSLNELLSLAEANEEDEEYEDVKLAPRPINNNSNDDYMSLVMDAFNNQFQLEELLLQYGYTKHGKRYKCPASTTGLAGVKIFRKTNTVFSHHGSDVLSANGKNTHDAFDVYRILAFGVGKESWVQAVNGAAALCGIQKGQKRKPHSTIVDFSVIEKELEEQDKKDNEAKKVAPKKEKAATKKNKGVGRRNNDVDLTIPRKFIDTAPETIKDVIEWMGGSRVKQPALAMFSAISATAVLMGRGYSHDELYPNIYTISVLGPGMGKDASLRCVKSMVTTACNGSEHLIAPSQFKSTAVLRNYLTEKQPVCISITDEIGVKWGGKDPMISDVKGLCTELYSASSYDLAPDVAMSRPDIKTVVKPQFNIYAVSAPEPLGGMLNKEDTLNGFAARIFLVGGDESAKKSVRSYYDKVKFSASNVPDKISNKLKAIFNRANDAGSSGDMPDISVGADGEANEVFNSFEIVPSLIMEKDSEGVETNADQYLQKMETYLHEERVVGESCAVSNICFSRCYASGVKLAMISATLKNPVSPSISLADAEWGMGLSMVLTQNMVNFINANIVKNEHEGYVKEIELIIKKRGSMWKRDLREMTKHINQVVRDGIIADLIENHVITLKNVVNKNEDGTSKAGRPKLRLYWGVVD